MSVTMRDLVLRFSADPAWAPGMAAELTAAIHHELPQLHVDEDLAAETLASTASIVSLYVERISGGGALDEVEPPEVAISFARELVRRGLPLDTLLRSYHIGHAVFFERWVAEVSASVHDPEDVVRVLQEAAVSSFTFVRVLDGGLVRRWADEREHWVRTTAAEHAETVRELLAGETRDPLDAGRRLGYELDGEHVAFVVWPADARSDAEAPATAALDRAAAAVAEALHARRRLIVPLRASLAAGWVDAVDTSILLARQPLPALDGVLVALGSTAAGVGGFRTSHEEALEARRVARLAGRRAGSVVTYRATVAAALASADMDRARGFVASELGPIAGASDEARRLAATLLVYMEEGLSPRRTARRLGVHENTVTNRVRTIEGRLGHPVKPRMTELLLALRLAPMVRSPKPDG